MNYRHAYHAGNFADVVKHIALVGVLLHLKKKDAPFAVIDTHAGRGLYDLAGSEATRTREADAGIAMLGALAPDTPPGVLSAYLAIARSRSHYPGSPLIAVRLMRPQDRLVAIEKHPKEAAQLRKVLHPFVRARVLQGDGYEQLPSLLPPPERRGVVLIDPPYESESDFADAARAIASLVKRFATGIALVWFPIKSKAAADRACGEVLSAGVTRALRIDIAISAPDKSDKERLSAAGLVVINPPFGFDSEIEAAMALVAPLLKARSSITWLTNP